MPTVLTGVTPTFSIDDSMILANQKVIDMNPVIAQLEPDASQLTTMLMKLPSKPAYSQKVEWMEDELLPRLTRATTAYLSGDVAIPVTAGTGQYFRARDIITNARTGENMLVDSVTVDTINVLASPNGRGFGSIPAAAGAIGDDIVRLGNAAYEGQRLGDIKMVQKIAQYNYCQIQRNPFGVTETLAATKLYGGSEPEAEAKKKLIEHKRDMENTAFFGRRKLSTATPANTVTGVCGGLIDYATQKYDMAGVLTTAKMETMLQLGFRFGSRRKVFFCAPVVAAALSNFALSKLAPPSPSINTWGVQMNSYQSAQGDQVAIVVKREWGDFQAVTPMFGGIGFLVDMDNIRLRPLRSTVLKPHRQNNDEDSNKQEYLTEWSLEVDLPRTHVMCYGCTG